MPIPFRLTLGAIAASLLLAGCAHDKAMRTSPVTATPTATTSSSTANTKANRAAARKRPVSVTPTVTTTLPDRTGIAACDDYLSSYLACHRAAKIYAPDQLQSRYEAMRVSLLRDSMDPKIRPQLAQRCNSLATMLRETLHGKACTPDPAATSSSP